MRDDYLEEYYSFLRFPSVSTDDEYKEKLVECARWLVQKLTSIGLETQLVPTRRHPIVWARNKHQPGRRTVLIYGHYDVQPPDPLELWDSPPFEPVLKNGYVFARGATDNKGQILSHILGVQEALEQNGDLPVNLHFVIEGEEEIGSGNLPKFLSDNREALKCDVAVVSDTGMVARGVPTLSYGLRGVTALEIKITGAKMGLHSGVFGGAVANQEGDEILGLAERHLKKHLSPGVTMEITRGHSGPWYLTDPHSDMGQAAQRALREAFGKDPAMIREGGSIPIVSQFRDILGVETLLMGLALPDCRAHSPNENFPLENLEGGIRLNKAVLAELATK